MADAGDPTCWLHLTCAECGGMHATGEPCQLAQPRRAVHVRAPEHGSRGIAATELNATVVVLEPGAALAGATADRDVALTVVAGSGTLTCEGDADRDAPTQVELAPGTIAIVPAGSERAVHAGVDGLTYSSVHRRREGLTVT